MRRRLPADIARLVAEFAAACRRQGFKATHQRLEILRELAGSRAHPAAETIHARVGRRLPALSLDTVYRTLKLLEERGLIVRVGPAGRRARFDADLARHHHFVCSHCGAIGDLHDLAAAGWPLPPAVRRLGRVEQVYVELRGVCRRCQRRTAAPAGERAATLHCPAGRKEVMPVS